MWLSDLKACAAPPRLSLGAVLAGAAVASMGLGLMSSGALAVQPEPWQVTMQPAATPVAEQMHWFHNFLLYIITGIVGFVVLLLAYVLVRFRESVNPTPSRTTHNTLLEIVWTVVPILILLVIAIPSFRLLYAQFDFPKADLTIKAIGSQWYWTYEYPDYDDLTFDAVMVEDDKLQPGQLRLLTTDNKVVVPVNSNVEVLVTGTDVIHSWAVPAFGVKVDAVPGRVLRTWFRAERTGTYYGECSELCGSRHAFMPIEIRVVSKNEFTQWLAEARKKFASSPGGGGTLVRLDQ